MARALRIDVPNGVYYVTSRGLEGQGIVRDETDCGKWFALLGLAERIGRCEAELGLTEQ